MCPKNLEKSLHEEKRRSSTFCWHDELARLHADESFVEQMRALATRIIGSREDAEDVLQHAYYKLLAREPPLHAESSIRRYVSAVVRRSAIDQGKKTSRTVPLGDLEVADYEASAASLYEAALPEQHRGELAQEFAATPKKSKARRATRKRILKLLLGEDLISHPLYESLRKLRSDFRSRTVAGAGPQAVSSQ